MTVRLTALALVIVAATACKKETSKSDVPAPPLAQESPVASARFDIEVTTNGFEPEDVQVPAGKPVTLVFTRKTDETCAKEVILTLDDGKTIEKELPLNQAVELAVTFPSVGKLTYACGMDMLHGTISVQ